LTRNQTFQKASRAGEGDRRLVEILRGDDLERILVGCRIDAGAFVERMSGGRPGRR